MPEYCNQMDRIEELEIELANDRHTGLREQLAANDDRLLESLVAIRKAKGLTREEVARRMNRSAAAVVDLERLGADPHLSTIRRYAAAIGARIDTSVTDADYQAMGGPP